jgi:hypothetical protein
VRLRVRLKNNKIHNPLRETFLAIQPLFGGREFILNSLILLRIKPLRSYGFVLIIFRSLGLAECGIDGECIAIDKYLGTHQIIKKTRKPWYLIYKNMPDPWIVLPIGILGSVVFSEALLILFRYLHRR